MGRRGAKARAKGSRGGLLVVGGQHQATPQPTSTHTQKVRVAFLSPPPCMPTALPCPFMSYVENVPCPRALIRKPSASPAFLPSLSHTKTRRINTTFGCRPFFSIRDGPFRGVVGSLFRRPSTCPCDCPPPRAKNDIIVHAGGAVLFYFVKKASIYPCESPCSRDVSCLLYV